MHAHINEFYSYGKQSNKTIDEEIQQKQEIISWNLSYVECLAISKVTFDQPEWTGKDIKSDIIDDLYMIAKSITSLTKEEKEMLYSSYELNIEELRGLLIKYGYFETKKISAKLIELYSKQNKTLEEQIQKLSKQKLMNDTSNKLIFMLGMVPQVDNADKILKYERSLQKSIYQNLIMLKKLQGSI